MKKNYSRKTLFSRPYYIKENQNKFLWKKIYLKKMPEYILKKTKTSFFEKN